jgi:hypothetical protein
MSQAERAIESFYEDAKLLNELADSDARVLMQWAEKEIEGLARRNLPDAQFDEAVKQLRQLLIRINRYVGRYTYLTPEEQQGWINQIVETASTLGYEIPVEQMSAQASAQGVPDTRTVLTGLLQVIDSSKTQAENVEMDFNASSTQPPLLTDSHTGESNDEEIER